MKGDELIDAVAFVALRLGKDGEAHDRFQRIIAHYSDALTELRGKCSPVSQWKELAAFTGAARREALEEAAAACEARIFKTGEHMQHHEARQCAAAIRALKDRA